LGQRLVHYIPTVGARAETTLNGPYYLQHPAQKQNFGGRQFKDGGYLETVVTQWLITRNMGCWQGEKEKLDTRQVPEFLERQYGKTTTRSKL
jgi:hypothetical protein